MMKQKKKRPLIFAALARRIIALGLGLWLAFMVLVTWSAAVDMYHQLQYKAQRTVSWGYNYLNDDGYAEYSIISDMGRLYYQHIDPIGPFMRQRPCLMSSDDWYWGKWELIYGFEPAMLVIGTTKGDSPQDFRFGDRDYLYFTYMDKLHYTSLPQNSIGYGYIDLTSLADTQNDFIDHVNNWSKADGMPKFMDRDFRMTGWFEGGQFHPVTIDLATYTNGSWSHSWKQLLTLPVETDKELVEIYIKTVRRIGMPKNPITENGTTFDSLTDLLDSQGIHCSNDNLFDAVIVATQHHDDVYGKYYKAVAFRCSPIGYAVLRLIPFYLITGAITGFAVFWILRRIRKNLTEPLWVLRNAAITGAAITPRSDWFEIYRLEEDYTNSRQALAEANAETQRLRTALSYAQDAEKNRRELISGITHELKTPLAVIHGYAEGLQAGIAEDKKDRYLSVILEETEKMDATVLELLDLSRLEAGKVHLSMDTFSLLALTQTVADKFAPLLEARNLTISYGVAEDFRITADESRIEQVITNLISNAVKYAPDGSCIYISVCLREKLRQAFFSIDNESPPLTDQQLEKVWDSFYRTDPSRSAPGTGLGLALVKRIIDLHQGKCLARNRKYISSENATTRVEFSFTLPLS